MGRLAFAQLLSLALAIPALAVDGVREINQTCAGLTGCFTGDTAGFPVTISSAGSYKLTSNLLVPNTFTDGILVNTDNVSIDLAGFEIRGPVVCSGSPLACTPDSGTGRGVAAAVQSGISVRNGSIRGMGTYGVLLPVQSEVMNVRVQWNRFGGLHISAGSTVSDNTAYQNGFDGISADFGSTVSGNTAYRNARIGINTGNGSTVSGNTAFQNGSLGIATGSGSTVSGNTAYQNVGAGIYATGGSTLSGNTAYFNDGDGIETLSGATVWGNTVSSNADFGLNLGSQSGYRENVISNNTDGTVTGAGFVNLGGNACNGSPICP